ncbi:MAG: hypothetical protein D6805_07940 [Planctomycetota bacterium]|nr:MAG: hypothetical protein D6805_07940 [Planctomycetota bacterium]
MYRIEEAFEEVVGQQKSIQARLFVGRKEYKDPYNHFFSADFSLAEKINQALEEYYLFHGAISNLYEIFCKGSETVRTRTKNTG